MSECKQLGCRLVRLPFISIRDVKSASHVDELRELIFAIFRAPGAGHRGVDDEGATFGRPDMRKEFFNLVPLVFGEGGLARDMYVVELWDLHWGR